ncbi:MAG: hypothetical protein WDO24_17110, partial [Pseudomonadota bacterium]
MKPSARPSRRSPTVSPLPLLIGHCRIELADGALPNLPEAVATGSPREQLSIKFARARALEMCRAGDRVRASQLLRFLAGYDPTMADTYRDMLAPGRSPASLAPTVERDPPFIQALGIADVPIDALKQAHHGKRLLLVYRRFFPAGGVRQSEVIECLASSATRFGLVVRAFEFDGSDSTGLASALLQEILAFRPDLIVYDHEYPVSMSGEPAAIREQIETVFAMARQQLDVRIVLSYMDALAGDAERPQHPVSGSGASLRSRPARTSGSPRRGHAGAERARLLLHAALLGGQVVGCTRHRVTRLLRRRHQLVQCLEAGLVGRNRRRGLPIDSSRPSISKASRVPIAPTSTCSSGISSRSTSPVAPAARRS